MKLLRPNKKWVLATIGLLLVLLIMKIVLFLTAKPKIAVDYVAEYNRISRPQNYDPDQNAAPYYQKAFDAFVDMPDEVKPYINWPTDFNNAEQALLEKWLISNTLAFEYFREASNRPYYWLERKAKKDNYIDRITTPDLAYLRELTEALTWDAKLNASKGQFQTTFENILDCYKAGNHKCRPNLFLIGQHVGLRIKKTAIKDALVILDRSQVDNKASKFLQDNLQVEIDNDAYVPSIQTEKYFLYDTLQRTFTDNGKGTGRLAFNVNLEYITLGGIWPNLKRKLYYCFKGPTRNEIVEQIEQSIALSDPIMTKIPWQIKDSDYLKEIQKINESNDFLEHIGRSTESIFFSYHETRAQTDALIAVLAILRYKAETVRFPESLDKLVSTGYLQALPNDPYSDGPLVYKLTGGNFTLYSVGDNFKNDGGEDKLDTIYWPVQRRRDGKLLSKYKPQEPDSYSWYPNGMKEAIRKRLEERGSVPPKR